MYADRTITLRIDAEKQMEMQAATDRIEWFNALGYLASWGPQYPRVEIFDDGTVDMVALYYDAEGNCDYDIVAVWHGDHYGFHS